jgi:hypothetical protein
MTETVNFRLPPPGSVVTLRVWGSDGQIAPPDAVHSTPARESPLPRVTVRTTLFAAALPGFETTKSRSVFVTDGTGVVEPLAVSETRSPSDEEAPPPPPPQATSAIVNAKIATSRDWI